MLDKHFVRLGRLAEDILDTSRLHLGKTALRLERLDLRTVVEEATDSVRLQVAERQQWLQTHVTVPTGPVWIHADSWRLQQVVSNLLVNAVTYTDGGGRLWVDLICEERDAVLTVGDTGRGIASDRCRESSSPSRKAT